LPCRAAPRQTSSHRTPAPHRRAHAAALPRHSRPGKAGRTAPCWPHWPGPRIAACTPQRPARTSRADGSSCGWAVGPNPTSRSSCTDDRTHGTCGDHPPARTPSNHRNTDNASSPRTGLKPVRVAWG
jgi:hypothetical protein